MKFTFNLTMKQNSEFTEEQFAGLVKIATLNDAAFDIILKNLTNIPTLLAQKDIVAKISNDEVSGLKMNELILIYKTVFEVAQIIFNGGYLRDPKFLEYLSKNLYTDLKDQIDGVSEPTFSKRFIAIFSLKSILHQLIAVATAIQSTPNSFAGVSVQPSIKPFTESGEIIGSLLFYEINFSYNEEPIPNKKRDVRITFDIGDIKNLIAILNDTVSRYESAVEKVQKMDVPLYSMQELK